MRTAAGCRVLTFSTNGTSRMRQVREKCRGLRRRGASAQADAGDVIAVQGAAGIDVVVGGH